VTADLDRVTKRLSGLVLDFLKLHHAGQRFTMADLASYIYARDPLTAPGSPCRVLRRLRETGAARVDVVDASASLYVVVEPPPEPAWRRCQRDGHVYDHETDYQCRRCGEDRGGYGTDLFGGERFE